MTTTGTPLARAFARLEIETGQASESIVSAVRSGGQRGQQEAESQGKQISERLKKGVEFGAAFYGGEALFRGVTEGIRTVVESADQLKESSERVDRVFGESSGSVLKFGQDAAKSYGLTAAAADQMNVKLGALLTNLHLPQEEAAKMSVQLIKLAADLAAFNHTDTASAEQALQSALAGRTQGLKQYGIVVDAASVQQQALKDGLIKTVKDGLDPAQKAQATYEVILARSGVQQGAFARGSGSLAEQTKILSAELTNAGAKIGGYLVPALVDGAKGLQTLGRGASDGAGFFEHNAAAATVLAGVLGAAAIPKLTELANVSQRLIAVNIESFFASSAGGIRAMGAALLENPELYALAAGLAAAGAAVEIFGSQERSVAVDVQTLTDAVRAQDTTGGTSLYDQILKQFGDTTLGSRGENVLEYLQRYKVNVAEAVTALEQGKLYGSSGALNFVGQIFGDPTVNSATQDKLTRLFTKIAGTIGDTRKAEQALRQEHAQTLDVLSRTPQGRLYEFLGSVADAQKKLSESTKVNNTALSNQIDVLKGYQSQADVTAASIKQHILDSITVITSEGNNVAELAANGVSARFIDKLKAEGPEYVAAVAGQAPAVQRQLSGLFQDSRVAALSASKQMAAAEAPALANTVKQGAGFVAAAANATFRNTVASAVSQARKIAEDGGTDAAGAFGIHGEAGKNQVLQHMLAALPGPVRTAALQALGIATAAGGKIPGNLAAAIESHQPVAVSAAENLRRAVQARIDALHGKTVDVVTQDNASNALHTIAQNLSQLEALNNTLKATRIGAADGGLISGPGGPRDDVIPAWLSDGEAVVPAHLVPKYAAAFSADGLPGFANGGYVDTGARTQDVLSSHPFVQSFADYLSGGQYAALLSGGIGGNGGAGAQQWAPLVAQVLGMFGLDTPENVAKWLRQITSESGGNASIVQNVHDINSGGNEAVGLVQVTPGTFASYAGPFVGLGRTNPLANLYAGMAWDLHKSQAPFADIGFGHGYDHGGPIQPGWNPPIWNGTGKVENVRTAAEEDRTNNLLAEQNRILRRLAGATGASVASALNGTARHSRLDLRTRTR